MVGGRKTDTAKEIWQKGDGEKKDMIEWSGMDKMSMAYKGILNYLKNTNFGSRYPQVSRAVPSELS